MSNDDKQNKTHRLILMPSGRKGDVPHGITLLDAARSLGVELEAICGGRQTCGRCQVVHERGTFAKHGITSGDDHLSAPGENEIAYAAAHDIDLSQRRLACAAQVIGDVLISVPPESQAHKQVVRKDARDITIRLDPAVRLVYVEVEPAEMDGVSDWQRLQAALASQWDLTDVTIDHVVLIDLQQALRDGDWALTVTLWKNREVIRVMPGYVDELIGLAVDVGSTTIAGYLCDLLSGRIIATESMMNPQIRYGEDLMSRVSYGNTEPQGVNRLNRAVIKAINDLARAVTDKAEIDSRSITDSVLVGNTVMHHLLLGIDPVQLGAAPFALAISDTLDLNARDLGLSAFHPAAKAHILPCIAGHVGADNVAVLLAELPNLDDHVTLIVDIGTNAEILLGNRDRLLSASSPTGPAFEGAQILHGQRAAAGAIERVRIDVEEGTTRYKTVGDDRWSDQVAEGESLTATGICGSGIIEIVGELFLNRLIDSTGLFADDADQRHPAVRQTGRIKEFVLVSGTQTAAGSEIVVTQNDIRQIQLAKGALYAGVRLLMDRLGVDHVDRIKLAGAFGSYIDPFYAMLIGLIPDCELENVEPVGNAAGDGARIALLNVSQREIARQESRKVDYVETAIEPDFQAYFVDAMDLPHQSDPFPHLVDYLPPRQPRSSRSTRRHRRA
ncbi:MAG: DUF4445 domain-containing protein [Anaerolineae bacterium]|nr:DUF4445 domain-containing protein [Anaerolineae bacterium]